MITFAFLCLSARAAAQGFIAGCWETVPDAEPHVSEYSFGNAWPSALVRAWAIDKSNGQVAAEYNYTVTSHAYNGNGTTLRFNTSGFADTEWTFTTVTPASLVGSSASVYGTYPVSLMRPSTSPKQCKAVTPTTASPPTTTTMSTTTASVTPGTTTSGGSTTTTTPSPTTTSTTTTTATATTTTSTTTTTTTTTTTQATVQRSSTLLSNNLTADSGTNTGDSMNSTQGSTSSASATSDLSAGNFSEVPLSDGGPLFETDPALPIGLGVGGGVLLCACLAIAVIVVKRNKRKSGIETQKPYDASVESHDETTTTTTIAGSTPSSTGIYSRLSVGPEYHAPPVTGVDMTYNSPPSTTTTMPYHAPPITAGN
jgi:hypothetical protein